VFMPFHFAETNANQITQSAFDPISREPNYKQCAVAVQLSGSAKAEPGKDTRHRKISMGVSQ
jgi:predicted molibdopterin-dependent oxidoreductase YjgC